MARKNYPGSIDQRGDTFRIRMLVNGKRHSFTFDKPDKDAAERFAMAKYLELRHAVPATERRARRGLPRDVQFSVLLAMYESDKLPERAPGAQEAYKDSFKPLRKYFVDELGDPSIDGIDNTVVNAFLTWRGRNRLNGDERLSNRTVAKDRAVLHRLFEFAMATGLTTANPVAQTDAPESDDHDPVILSADEYEKLVKACDERPMLQLYTLALGEAGLRSESECLWLQWPDVKLNDGFLWVAHGRHHESRGTTTKHRTKGGKGRWVPMTQRLMDAMRTHFATYRFATYGGKASPWIFHHEFTRRHAKAGERIGSLRSSFAAAAERAKLPEDFSAHDLRHRRVTTWLGEGKSPVHVKEAMGHSSLETTMKYWHLSREHLRSLVDTPAPNKKLSGRRA